MNLAAVDRIAKALLYEGYMLYPYRASAVKNRQRFNFGVLYPHLYAEPAAEPWFSRAECIVNADALDSMEVRVRFLHLVQRTIYEPAPVLPSFVPALRPVERLEVDGESYQTWQEAVEREICIPKLLLGSLAAGPLQHTAEIPASYEETEIRNATQETVGSIVRTQRALKLLVELTAEPSGDNLHKLTVTVRNLTETQNVLDRDQALLHAAASVHIILGTQDGEFVSLLDPPQELRPLVETCQSAGGFPVLIGEAGQRDTMLFSPIILYDYPEIAAESAGDLFDATEIDEILSLRIMTLTDEEKREARGSDERARRILDRTDSLPQEQLMKLHGAVRGLRPVNQERAG